MTRVTRYLFLMIGGLLLQPTVSYGQDTKQIEEGRRVYNRHCVICHGDKGDGKGLMGVIHRVQQKGMVIHTYPRDFTAGMYKFRSTPSGYLPTEDDLLRIVSEGIARSGMPSHNDLTLDEQKAAIAFIKTFSKRWDEEGSRDPISIAEPPAYMGTKASLDRGRQLYEDAGCFNCHGRTGKGDGPSSATLKDNWGDKILPFDFTSGALKGGSSPKDIYKTFVTGLDGTPMPSYEESLNEQQRWDLVSYCMELMAGAPAANK